MINQCEAGHIMHQRKIVNTILGEMIVYNWEEYKDQTGLYCTGQDDISRTLINTGSWEDNITKLITKILTEGNKAYTFMDIGCNIGWYSRLALQLGYRTKSFDFNAEHLQLLALNAPEAIPLQIWFDDQIKARKWCESCSLQKGIELVKIDIEGNEQYAIDYLESCIGVIKNIIMEVSPVFNNSYPALIARMRGYGFDVFEIDGTPFDNNYNFEQKDLWLKKI